jgi:hypothetical protein
MTDYSVQRVGDLPRDERILVERWLGRPLSNDETISLNAHRPHPAPAGAELDLLRQDILTQAREIGSRAPVADEQDLDSLLDEAFGATRGRRG